MGFFKDVDDMDNEDLLSELESLSNEGVVEDAGVEEVFSTLNEIDENSEEYINTDSELLEALNGIYNEPAEDMVVNEDTVVDDDIGAEAETGEMDNTSSSETIIENITEESEYVAEEVAAVSEEDTSAVVSVPEYDNSIVEESVSDEVSEKEVTVITKGTTINGSISADCSLEVMGVITGDVECQGKLTIFGTVSGNTEASEIYVNTPVKLIGDMKSTGCVKISDDSKVVGNITAVSAFIGGAIKGDIEASGPVVVDSSAVVLGDITAGSLQLNNGAVVKGICTIGNDSGIDTLFD